MSKSRKAIILADGLINRTVCMLDESASKAEKKKNRLKGNRKVIIKGKEVRHQMK